MNVKIVKTIVSKIGALDLKNYQWLYVSGSEEGEEIFAAADHLNEAADAYGVSKDLLNDIEEALGLVAETIRDKVEEDLIDLYKKIEALEKKPTPRP